MVEYRHINLKSELPAEDFSKLAEIMDELPLTLEGAHIKKNLLADSENPAIVEALKGRNCNFILQPVKGDKIICYLDSYLVGKKYEIPNIRMFPGWSKDPRPVWEIDSNFEKENYRICIFPRAIGD